MGKWPSPRSELLLYMLSTLSQRLRPWLSRLVLFSLAPLIGLSLSTYLLWLEYQTQYAARHIGAYLLRHNQQRQPRGALWQGILASRRTRLALADSLAEFASVPQRTPLPVLHNRYSLQQHGPYAAFLKVRRRPTALQPDRLAPEMLRELARSLQVYQQGRDLLSRASMPSAPLRVHALIGTQIALEDGALFPRLHRHLLALDASEAWTFLRMDEEEQDFWRTHLSPLLETELDALDSEVAPIVRRALQQIVQSWQDSLHRDEIDRLLKGWDGVNGFEIRLTRGADQFAAYALFPDEVPTPFSLPTPLVEKRLGLDAEEPPR